MKKALLFALLMTLTACAYVDPSITDQTTVYSDSPVRKSPLQVSVHPRDKQDRPLTAYFHPFAIQQESSDYAHLSNAFAQIFHNVWTEERLFPVQEFEPGTPYRGVNAALRRARERGADLLVLGSVPYFYAGHTLDDTAITIQMDVYATGNGARLWTMMQSGRIEDKLPDDYIYFRHEFRMSESSFNKLIRSIAKDMAVPLKGWLPDPDAQYEFAETSQEMKDELAPEGEPKEKELPEEVQRPKAPGLNLDILFEFDRANIETESFPRLDALAEALKSEELRDRKIIIAGHTDSKGTDVYNLKLSKDRAEAIKAYLVKKWGIDPEMIQAVGYGKSRPLTTGLSAEEMRKNRRVEIRIAE